MKKSKLLSFIIICIFVLSLCSFSNAGFERDYDVIPPDCAFTIENATYKDGIYYTNDDVLNLNIIASDNTCTEEDLEMYISNGPATINKDIIWQPFSQTVSFPVTEYKNDIQVFVRDSFGNISSSKNATFAEYTITYSASGATNVPAQEKAIYGRPYNITMQEPKMANKYFIGWSETSGSTTVTYKTDDTIIANKITGNKTLYAVWADEASLLSEVVEIGDFVDYPATYTNISTNTNKANITGWRVVDVTNGVVKLISAGTPLTYTTSNSATTINNLTTNFTGATFASNGFSQSLTATFANDYTTNVSMATTSDVNNMMSITNGADVSSWPGILTNTTTYLIASDSTLYSVSGADGKVSTVTSGTYGIRPVITLAAETYTLGRNEDGSWKINNPQAYAVYSADDNSLNFYRTYKDLTTLTTYNGKTITNVYTGFEEATYTSTTSVPWNGIKSNVKTVNFIDEIAPISTAYWFAGFDNTTSFTVTNLNTSNVTTMQSMFDEAGRDAATLEFVGINTFDTSKVTNMESTFDSIGFDTPEVTLDISNWDTQNVTNMSYMFRSAGYNADKFNIDVSNFNTSKLENAYIMFGFVGQGASDWSIGNLSTKTVTRADGTTYTAWDVSKVENMDHMFIQAGVAANEWNIGDLSGWAPTSLTDMSFMFSNAARYARNNINLNLSNFNTSKITDMQYVFNSFGPRKNGFSVKMNLSGWDTSKVTDMYNMFTGCSLSEITLGNKFSFKGAGTTTLTTLPTPMPSFAPGANGYWYNTANIGYLPENIPNNVADTYYASAESYAVYSADDNSLRFYKSIYPIEQGTTFKGRTVTNVYTGFETATYASAYDVPWNGIATNVTSVVVEDKIVPISTAYWFAGYSKTTTMDLTKLDTSKVTNMKNMFYQAGQTVTSFSLIGINKWNTSQVTDMNYMFGSMGYNATTFIMDDISNWDTSKVTDMGNMFNSFARATSTFEFDLSKWDTSQVTDMSYMFRSAGYKASKFNLNLSNWGSDNLKNMAWIFDAAGHNSTDYNLNISGWNTSKVTDMTGAFFEAGYNSTNFEIVGLNNLNTSSVQNMSQIFRNAAYNSTTINLNVSNWNTSSVTNMYYAFYNLGYEAKNNIILDLSNWNTLNVVNMTSMFSGIRRLEEITLGTNFSFTGNGTTRLTNLPTPGAYYIPLTDGKWYNIATYVGYTPENVPNKTAATYSANPRYVVTLNANGGSVSPTTIKVIRGEAYGDLPTPTRSGYNFLGWYTDATNGTQVTTSTTVGTGANGQTLYAHWEESIRAFAVYSATDNSLTFYKNADSVTQGGTYKGKAVTKIYTGFETATYTYDELTGESTTPWYEYCEDITYVEVVDEGISPISTAYWFCGLLLCERLELLKLDTSNVTNMKNMFEGVGSWITYVNNKSTLYMNIASWDTSNVTDMSYMFSNLGGDGMSYYTKGVKNIVLDISDWNTSNVTDMSYMFAWAGGGVTAFEIDLSNWNTSSVRDMSHMFDNAGDKATTWSIEGLSNWNTSNVTNMSAMFSYAGYSATTFTLTGLNNWNTASVTNMNSMFSYAGRNSTPFSLDLSGFDTSKVTDMTDMFDNMRKLSEIKLGSKFTFNGNGTTRKCNLPTPSSNYIPGADGCWYNSQGVAFTPADVPNNVADTYTVCYELTANAPVIVSGLTPVNWSGSEWVTTSEANWDYNYNSVARATHSTIAGNGNGKWANAQTTDGSLYVWIPRYSYRITEESGKSGNSWNSLDSAGNNQIEIRFSEGTDDYKEDGFIAHPAFDMDGNKLTGIWVAKYEASRNDATNESAGTGTIVASKPGVISWRTTTIGEMFNYALNTNPSLNSHMMKNSEWGAVAYLTNAIGRTPYINNSSTFITGNAGGSQDAPAASGVTNKWDSEAGVKASTTHNVYGIYDLSGGAYEYVAAYVDNGNPNLTTYGAQLVSGPAKYKDLYPAATTESQQNNYNAWSNIKGDAVYETSSTYTGSGVCWDADYASAPSGYAPFFVRGGWHSDGANAGLFHFHDLSARAHDNYSFRVVLTPEDKNTTYKVQHWLQNINAPEEQNSTNYTKVEDATQTFTAMPGTTITAATNIYEGFTAKVVNPVTIAAGGRTVINCYYTRNSYELTLTAGEGIASVSGAGTYQFGENITMTATLAEEDGYEITFDGWYLKGVENQTTNPAYIKMTAGDLAFEARATKVAKQAFAIYSETDNSLRFYKRAEVPEIGDTYGENNNIVTEVYIIDEDIAYEYDLEVQDDDMLPWAEMYYFYTVEEVSVEDKISPVSTAGWFYELEDVKTFKLEKLDTSRVTDMSYMFYVAGYNVTSFEIIGLSNWNTSSVIDMSHMFYHTGYWANTWNIGDLSNKVVTREDGTTYTAWDTTNVTDMNHMFYYAGYSANSWNIGDLSNWNTANVTDMSGMFSRAGFSTTEWNIGDLSNWNTAKVTDMGSMFYYAGYSATEWNITDLSTWNTASVTDMCYMFDHAGYSAEPFALNLSGWDTRNVTSDNYMFYSCVKLKEISIGKNFTCAGQLPDPSGDHIPGADGYWYNKATGEKYIGPTAIPKNTAGTYTAIAPVNKYTVNFDLNVGLPAGYTLLEYIESTGTQYIDTGYSAPNGFIGKAKMSLNRTKGADVLVGSHNIEAPYGRNYISTRSGWMGWELGTGDTNPIESTNYTTGTIYNLEFSTVKGNSYLKVDGTTLMTTTDNTSRSSNNLLIFTEQYALNGGSSTGQIKLYSLEIYDNTNNLVRKYVPCKNASGVIGLYDMVEGKFYDNDGTGTFSYGSVITETSKKVTLGNQYGTLPTPTREGYNFNGWYTAASGGSKITSTTKVTTAANHTLYAQWSIKTYTITATAGENGTITPTSATVNYGGNQTIKIIPNSGYEVNDVLVDGVSVKSSLIDMSCGDVNGDGYLNTNDSVDIQQYLAGNETFTEEQILIADIDGNGIVEEADATAILRYVAGYDIVFYKNKAYIFKNVVANHTISATFKKATYTVTFDANGGQIAEVNAATTTKTVTAGETYGELPTATRSGYLFVGWFDNSTAKYDSSIKYKEHPWIYYADAYSDLYNAFGYNEASLKNHYEQHGRGEGRRTSQYISTDVVELTGNRTVYAVWNLATYDCACAGCNASVTSNGAWCSTCGSVCSSHTSYGYCRTHCTLSHVEAGYITLKYQSYTTTGGDTDYTEISSHHGGTISVEETTSYGIGISISGTRINFSGLSSLSNGSIVKIKVTSGATSTHTSASATYTITIGGNSTGGSTGGGGDDDGGSSSSGCGTGNHNYVMTRSYYFINTSGIDRWGVCNCDRPGRCDGCWEEEWECTVCGAGGAVGGCDTCSYRTDTRDM